jgi:aldehyde dehydrogenase (NAD+)
MIESISPIDGSRLGAVEETSPAAYEETVARSVQAFEKWRLVPAPRRGAIVREFGEALRREKNALAEIVTLEAGKIRAEALGEVQEMIDIADFAVGLSRQLYGLTMHSERPGHRMYEQWHPLGPVGVISAFNFPVAVWSWNALIAAVCGDTVIWKPAPQTPLCAAAVQRIADRVFADAGHPDVFQTIQGGRELGERLADDSRLPLISATGSTAMGRAVGERVARRLGRSLLELGGNNAMILMADADLDLALRAVLFGAVGTAGQRCTTLRRLFLHRSIAEPFLDRLRAAYSQIRIGDPRDASTLVGPLISRDAVERMQSALRQIVDQGGELIQGGRVLRGNYVEPAIVRVPQPIPMMREEVFAPILYGMPIDSVEQGIAANNDVPQGLSSAIFTRDVLSAEAFLSAAGSDCGIANVNIGTSGAEIGGAFGGEKDTGGGREAGSDSWKAYMRRQTVTINWSRDLPLAQGIRFDV